MNMYLNCGFLYLLLEPDFSPEEQTRKGLFTETNGVAIQQT